MALSPAEIDAIEIPDLASPRPTTSALTPQEIDEIPIMQPAEPAKLGPDTRSLYRRAVDAISQKLEPITPQNRAFPRITALDVQTGNVRSLLPGVDPETGESFNTAYAPGVKPGIAAKIAAGTERAVAGTAETLVPFILGGSAGNVVRVPLAHRAVSAYFAQDMLRSLPDAYKAFIKAVDTGDVETAAETGVGGALAALFSVAAARHAVGPTKIPQFDVKGNPLIDPKTGEPVTKNRGIAEESPAIRWLLTQKIAQQYSPAQIKEIYRRANVGEANPAEQELVRFINSELERPGEAARKGVAVTEQKPIISSEFWRDYLGLKGSRTISLMQPEAKPAAATPPPITPSKPQPKGRTLRLLTPGEIDAIPVEQPTGGQSAAPTVKIEGRVPSERAGVNEVGQTTDQASGGHRLPSPAGQPTAGPVIAPDEAQAASELEALQTIRDAGMELTDEQLQRLKELETPKVAKTLPPIIPGNIPITITRADGTSYPAVFAGYQEIKPGEFVPTIGRANPGDDKWSHTFGLNPGETITEGAIPSIPKEVVKSGKEEVQGQKEDVTQPGAGTTPPPSTIPTKKPTGSSLRKPKGETKELRRGTVGGMLESGEVVLTSSGRRTTPFPKVKLDTERKTNATLKAVEIWLRENALAEARSRGDEFNARWMEAEKPGNIPPASKDSMEEYLFGEQPQVIKSPLKDVTPKPVEKPATQDQSTGNRKLDRKLALQERQDKLLLMKPEGITVQDNREVSRLLTSTLDNGYPTDAQFDYAERILGEYENRLKNKPAEKPSPRITFREGDHTRAIVNTGSQYGDSNHAQLVASINSLPIREVTVSYAASSHQQVRKDTESALEKAGWIKAPEYEKYHSWIKATAKSPVEKPATEIKSPLSNLKSDELAELEALEAELKKKFGATYTGIDPEIAVLAAKMANIYAKGGVRTFDQFARNVKERLPSIWDRIKAYLRAAWNQIADMLGFDEVSRVDAEKVFGDIEKTTEVKVEPKVEPAEQSIRDIITSADDGQKKSAAIRKLAEKEGLTVKQMQERVEAELVKMADEIARESGTTPREKFERLVELYNKQPTLSARTSTSVEDQAYSTPMPLAYALSHMTGVTPQTDIYEPTAGNGMLMIGGDLEHSEANELNAERAKALRALGVGNVTENDATKYKPSPGNFQVVVSNPPFGTIPNVNYQNFAITKLEHLIALKAFEVMANDGAGATILGAKMMEGGPVQKGAQWVFENFLYGHYHVVGNFELSGDLYAKQGASWPVRVLVVAGRRTTPIKGELAPKSVARLNSWDELWTAAERIKNEVANQHQNLGAGGSTGLPVPAPTQGTPAAKPGTVPTGASLTPRPASRPSRPGGKGGGQPAAGGQPATGVSGLPSGQTPARPGNVPPVVPQPSGGGKPSAPVQGQSGSNVKTPADAGERVPQTGTGPKPGIVPRPPGLAATEYQVPYVPRSEGTPFQTLSPTNIAEGEHAALDALVKRVGPVDEYVANRLNMEVEEVRNVMASEQIDGVALALDQIENGGALIIGDETGIGKGRQGAALIRYATLNGIIPVFFTKDPKLFSDMYGDLKDIHTEVKPLIFGDPSKATIVDPEGKVIHKAPGSAGQKSIMERIRNNGFADSGYNAIFITYSQINTRNERQQFLEGLASGQPTLVILDEAHEAAGDGQTSMQAAFISGGQVVRGSGVNRTTTNVPGLLRQVGTKQAQGGGVLYMSATYAKRPENMPVYFRTALSTAAQNFAQIVDAMKRGGVALQQAVSEALAKAGQYVRRERDFTGVSYDMREVEVENKEELIDHVDQVTDVLSEIVRFSHALRDAVLAGGGGASGTAMTQNQIDMTDFAAVVHNQVGQLLLAAKADAVVVEALATKARGEKPVIALMNTMESFLTQYVDEKGIESGSPIQLRWNELLKYALSRTLRISEKLSNGDTEISYADPADFGLEDAYNNIVTLADGIDSKFPVSPIDYILQKLNAAGVKMAELTGRESGIEYTDAAKGEGVYKKFKKANKNAVVNGFNNGTYDGMLLNASGSTGLSAHASTKFKDQRPRHMIIAQAALDISVFIQTLGRIKRTGMVMLGKGADGQPYGAKYSHMVLPLQAELRPAAMAVKKMKSLNANTTAAADNAIKIDAEDIFNRYGDFIVAQYLDDNQNLQIALGLLIDTRPDGSLDVPRDLARKFTGRMALLPDDMQKKAYSEVLPAYRQLIEQLKANGEYDLEIVVHDDWDGVIREDQELQAGTDESNIFTASLRMQRWEIKDKRHVPTGAEMVKEFQKNTGGHDKLIERWEAYKAKADNYLTKKRESLTRDLAAANDADKPKAQRALDLLDAQAHRWADTQPVIDSVVRDGGSVIELSNAETSDQYEGMLADLRFPPEAGTPKFSAGAFHFKFSVNAPGGVVYATGAQMTPDKWSKDRSYTRVDELTGRTGSTRIERYFVVGNPIRGYVATGGRGKMTRFNSADGKIITGLLMPNNWTPANLVNDPRLDLMSGRAVAHFLREFGTVNYNQYIPIEAGGVVRIQRVRGSQHSYTISTASARSTGGKIYLDDKLRRITGDFTKIGNRMTVDVDEADVPKVADRIMEIVGTHFRPVGDANTLMPQVSQSNNRARGGRPGNLPLEGWDEVPGGGSVRDSKYDDILTTGTDANTMLSVMEQDAGNLFEYGLIQRLKELGLKTKIRLAEQSEAAKLGKPSAQGIYLASDEVLIFRDAINQFRTILHELIHAATVEEMGTDDAYLKEITALFDEAKLSVSDSEYGMRNVYEFVAEAFASPEFQKRLKDAPAPKKSLWQRFVDWVKKLFGVKDKDVSLLERIIRTVTPKMRPIEEVRNEPLAMESAKPEEGETSETVNAAGIEHEIISKDRLTPEQIAKADGRAQRYLGKELGLPGKPDKSTRRGPGTTNYNRVFIFEPDGKNYDAQVEELTKHLTEQVQLQYSAGGDPAYVTSLVNAINMNFDYGVWDNLVSESVKEELLNVSVGESSRRGTVLRALRGLRGDLNAIAQNAALRLKWVWAKALDPDKTEKKKSKSPKDYEETLKKRAKQRGWKLPTNADFGEMKKWAERERALREPSPEEISKFKGDEDAAREAVEAATEETRKLLLRKINARWSSWTKPLIRLNHLGDLRDSERRYNTMMALNEWMAANLLAKIGFGGRQVTDVGFQMLLHTPVTAMQYAIENWRNDQSAKRDTNLIADMSQALTDAYRARLSVMRDALNAFQRTLMGKGEQRNVEHLLTSINVFDRLLQQANDLKAQGKPETARLLSILALTVRFGRQFAAAADVIQGVPAEAQEMAHQVRAGLREQGLGRVESDLSYNAIMGVLTTERVEATAMAKAMLEARGLEAGKGATERAAWHLLREKIYHLSRQAGLPADDMKAQNALFRDLIGWNLSETGGKKGVGGPGGLVAATGKFGKEWTAGFGLPAFPFLFANAMGISLNRKLSWTPLGFFPSFFKGSPWFEGERNQRRRKIEATIGTPIIGLIFTLFALGIWKMLPLFWPTDEKEKAKWIANGWKPGQIIIPWGEGEEVHLSGTIGPMNYFAPAAAAGAAFRRAIDTQEKKQQALNEKAAKLGLQPEQLHGLKASQWLGIMGNAIVASTVGGRTASGLVGSYSDFGNFNPKKVTASATSALLPLAPGYAELTRMAGINLDTKLSSVWDLVIPLPTSPRRVNLLGDPLNDENDVRRIFQIMTGGTYPIPTGVAEKEVAAYSALYGSDFRPPSIDPGRGYQFGQSYRPMTADELSTYTVRRGELFKAELSNLGPEPDKQTVQAAFQRANSAALTEIGAKSTTAASPARSVAAAGAAATIPTLPSTLPVARSTGFLARPRGASLRLPRGRSRRISRRFSRGPSLRIRKPLKFKAPKAPRMGRSLRLRRPSLARR